MMMMIATTMIMMTSDHFSDVNHDDLPSELIQNVNLILF